jgi:hypothetical protein
MTGTTKPNGDRDRDRQDLRLRYYVLPDDPVAALEDIQPHSPDVDAVNT